MKRLLSRLSKEVHGASVLDLVLASAFIAVASAIAIARLDVDLGLGLGFADVPVRVLGALAGGA